MKKLKQIPLARAITVATLTLAGASALAQQTIKIGTLAVLEGPLAELGQDANRGIDLALDEFKNGVAGKRIEVIRESTNAKGDVAVTKARKLLEQDQVDFVVGPLSGGEGLAIKELAKTVPGKTFINGTAAAQENTLRDPAPNFFSFSMDGAQRIAGLGNYVYDTKKYRSVAVVAEDYGFPYAQVAGFVTEFCRKGGKIPSRFWVPLGTKDYSTVIARIPKDVDAVFVVLGGADAVNFLNQYYQAGGKAPLIGGSITVDSIVLNSRGPFQQKVVGIPSASSSADDSEDPQWKEFVQRYRAKFPNALPAPSSMAHGYYISMKAALLAVEKTGGDARNQDKFREALRTLKFDTPTGTYSIDQNRQAIGDVFVTEVAKRPDGALFNKVVMVSKQVNQTLGVPREEFIAAGPASRDNPVCK